MRYRSAINTRWRRRLHAATAGLSLALWLLMTTAEACPALHAWLHGGKIPDNDDCAVVAVAQGKVQVITSDVPAVAPVLGVGIVPCVVTAVFRPVGVFLPDGRGPPVLFVVS